MSAKQPIVESGPPPHTLAPAPGPRLDAQSRRRAGHRWTGGGLLGQPSASITVNPRRPSSVTRPSRTRALAQPTPDDWQVVTGPNAGGGSPPTDVSHCPDKRKDDSESYKLHDS